jgi:phosphoglycolate phosphatase
MELDAPQEDELRGAIGPPLRQSFARLLARHGAEGRVEEALQSYRERFSAVGLLENRVYPGVPEMLGGLNAAGCRLFIATSKPAVFARRIVESFWLVRTFCGCVWERARWQAGEQKRPYSIRPRRRAYRGRRCRDDWGPES